MSILEKRVIVLGDTCCGKSFLIWKFINRKTVEVPTLLPEEYNQEIVKNGYRFRLNLIDTGYPEMEDRWIDLVLRSEHFSKADMILLCFDIGRFESLESVREFWMPEIKEHSTEREIPYVLVGLKKDLRHDTQSLKRYLPRVTAEEGKRIAGMIEASGYVECSAKCDDGVQEVFETVTNIFLKQSEKKPSKFNGFLKKIFG